MSRLPWIIAAVAIIYGIVLFFSPPSTASPFVNDNASGSVIRPIPFQGQHAISDDGEAASSTQESFQLFPSLPYYTFSTSSIHTISFYGTNIFYPDKVYKTFHSGEAIVTAYTPEETCKGECVTALGTLPRAHWTIACPRIYELGETFVVIDDHAYRCEDHTSIKMEGRFDIYMEDYAEARAFGKQRLQIRILKPL